jgi:hypothetical protein
MKYASFVLFSAIAGVAVNAAARESDYARVMQQITGDIAALKSAYPQLADFDTARTFSATQLTLTYGFHTHAPEARGGWTSGVPNPDADGLWFYIDLHDADSTAQIHTQPVTGMQCIGAKRVSFLILEGEHAVPIAGAIEKILLRHGVGSCNRNR